ncbi:raffinose/stachyose/melibiose transport system permease protein [Halanaerobium saccharolyticum]|jgi:raffinose/stachyose/melibiose transport system permease protein|uniref:Raffinose/stachyose/melibiose transport system permease protein n=1 Tax=Halanaerobium saccharolyticum TaxID=43595 RepID=A0A2T5RGB3_9FIRM|nr:carbohydrate ABC transporter permease [Halanaerobium saccharolyticum]PTV93620.1 raffinose/stachyose/melibiose transport system permease protein [Halanaerobium saccharolyticum]
MKTKFSPKKVLNKVQDYFIEISMTKFVIYMVLIAWASTTILPLLWVANNSFRTTTQIVDAPFSLPDSFNLANYVTATERINILNSYKNSLIMSGTTVLLVLLFGGMAGYAMSRFKFKFRGFINKMIVVALMIPAFVTVVPVYEIFIDLGIVNTYLALILPHTAGNLVFATMMLSAYMSSVSTEIEEAALLDGATRWQIFSRIFVPISRPAFATVGIFTFLWSYNDLFSALVFVPNKSVQPITVLLNQVKSQYGTDLGLQATAVIVTVIPVLLVYIILQKHIIKGLTQGAVKG